MVGGDAPYGQSPVTQEGHVERAGKREIMWAGGEGERVDGLRGRRSSGV